MLMDKMYFIRQERKNCSVHDLLSRNSLVKLIRENFKRFSFPTALYDVQRGMICSRGKWGEGEKGFKSALEYFFRMIIPMKC